MRHSAPELEEELQEKKTRGADHDLWAAGHGDPLAGRPVLRGLAAGLREAGIRASWPTDPARLDEITALVAAAVQQDANAARTPGRTTAEWVTAYLRRWRSLPAPPARSMPVTAPMPLGPPAAADPVAALARSAAAREALRQQLATAGRPAG
ncbi:hypothetical protein [Candidatus Frankia alpina]|uniref:Uncharacterized protein n=1 Tax=Candidatus Frankia alpina TaxID=2699483 RepID=A0A4S5ESH7_9ACTN|nr:hypothetical protein [Candidatus Frankia alpina]THJ75381.1 hypothetical protein E7Y31_05785 [Candidatus Frankia alpina]